MNLRARRLITLALGLAAVACQSTPTPTGSAASPGATGPGSATSGPAASVGDSGTPAASFVAGDGDLFLDPIEGLATLASHRATLTWSFDGTLDGQPSTWTEATTLAVATDPATAELVVARTNVPELPKQSWTSLIKGSILSTVDGGSCSVSLVNPDRTPFHEPAEQLSALIGGTQTGTESIEGVQADVFAFDGPSMGLVDPTTAAGKAWVSPSDELLLKYHVEIKGSEDYFGTGMSGTLTGDYVLTDVGAAIAVEVPADCPAGLIEGAQPTDASDVVSVPGMTRLHTGMKVAAAAAFYHDTSLAFGWKPVGEPKIQEPPDVAHLAFTQGALSITVEIVADGTGSLVLVTARRT